MGTQSEEVIEIKREPSKPQLIAQQQGCWKARIAPECILLSSMNASHRQSVLLRIRWSCLFLGNKDN